jgi:hypothetical protein
MSFNKSLYVQPLAEQTTTETLIKYRLENENQQPYGMLHNNFPYILKINKKNWSCVSQYVYVNLFDYVTQNLKTENAIEGRKNISTCAIKNLFKVYNEEVKKLYDEQTFKCINDAFQAKSMINDEIIEFLLFKTGSNDIIYESSNEFLAMFYGQILTQFRDMQKENWLNKQYFKAYVIIHILQNYLLTEDTLEKILEIEKIFLRQSYVTEEVALKLFTQLIDNYGVDNVKKLNISHITLQTNKTLLKICELSMNNPIVLCYYAYSTHLELCKHRLDNKKMDIVFHEYLKYKFLDKKTNKISNIDFLNTDSLLDNINQQLKSVNYDRLKGEMYHLFESNKIKSVNNDLHERIEQRIKDLTKISIEDVRLYKNYDFEKKYYQFQQSHQSYISLLSKKTSPFIFNDDSAPLLSFSKKGKSFNVNNRKFDSIKEYVDDTLSSLFSILENQKLYENAKKFLCQIALDKKFGISNNKNITIEPIDYFKDELVSLKEEIEYSRRVYDMQLVLAFSNGLNIIHVDKDNVLQNFVSKYISLNNKYLFKNLNYFGNIYVKSKFQLDKFIENDIFMIEWMKVHLKYILTLLGNITKYVQYLMNEENQIELSENKIISLFSILSDSNIFKENVSYRYRIEIPRNFAKQISDITDNFRELFRMDESVFLPILNKYLQHNIANMAEMYEGDEIKIKYSLTKFSLLLSQTKKCMSNASNNFYACCLLAILNVESKLEEIKKVVIKKDETTISSSDNDEDEDIFLDGGESDKEQQMIVSIILNIPYKVITKIAEKTELISEEVEEEEEDEEEKEEDYPEEEEGEEEIDGSKSKMQKEISDILNENPDYKEKTKFNVVEISSMISMIKNNNLPFHIKQARINMFYKIDI